MYNRIDWRIFMKSTITFRADDDTVERLQQLAAATDRSRSWHVAKAVTAYLDHQAWQIKRIEEGLADAAAGHVVEHEQVADWLSSWGTESETDPPI